MAPRRVARTHLRAALAFALALAAAAPAPPAPRACDASVAISPDEVDALADYAEAGAGHAILMTGAPFDLGPLESALARRESL